MRSGQDLDFHRGEELVIVDNSGSNFWKGYSQGHPELVANIPVNSVEIIEYLDPELRAQNEDRSRAQQAAREAEQIQDQVEEIERRTAEAEQAAALPVDVLMDECVRAIQNRQPVSQAMAAEVEKRFPAGREDPGQGPPIWGAVKKYNEAVAAQHKMHGNAQQELAANESVEEACRTMVLMQMGQPAQRVVPNELLKIGIPGIGLMTSSTKFRFYAVNPFRRGEWPDGFRLMVIGNHRHLGSVAAKEGGGMLRRAAQEAKESPVVEFARPSSDDDAMLEAIVSLPNPTEEDVRNDQRTWFSWAVCLVLGEPGGDPDKGEQRGCYVMASDGPQEVNYLPDGGVPLIGVGGGRDTAKDAFTNFAMVESLSFPYAAFEDPLVGQMMPAAIPLISAVHVHTEPIHPAGKLLVHAFRQLTLDDSDLAHALSAHGAANHLLRQDWVTKPQFLGLLNELNNPGRAAMDATKRALAYAFLMIVAGKDMRGYQVNVSDDTITQLTQGALILNPGDGNPGYEAVPSGSVMSRLPHREDVAIGLQLTIRRAMDRSLITWLRAIPTLNLIEKNVGLSHFTGEAGARDRQRQGRMDPAPGNIRACTEAQYRAELQFLSDHRLMLLDCSTSKRRFRLSQYAVYACPAGNVNAAMEVLGLDAGEDTMTSSPGDKHVRTALDAMSGGHGSFEMKQTILAHDQLLTDIVDKVQQVRGGLTGTVESVATLLEQVVHAVQDPASAKRIMDRCASLQDRANVLLCTLAMLQHRQGSYERVSLPEITQYLCGAYNSEHGTSLDSILPGVSEEKYRHQMAVRRYVEARHRRDTSNLHLLRTTSKLVTQVGWLEDTQMASLNDTVKRQLELDDVQQLLQELPLEGVHESVAKCLWDHCGELLKPDNNALHLQAMDGFTDILLHWTKAREGGANVMEVKDPFIDAEMDTDVDDDRYIEPGQVLTATDKQLRQAQGTITGLVRGKQTTLPREKCVAAEEGSYSGHINVQGSLKLLGTIADRALHFMRERVIPIEKLLSDRVLKLSRLYHETKGKQEVMEAREGRNYRAQMDRLTRVVEERAKSLADKTIEMSDLHTLMSEQNRGGDSNRERGLNLLSLARPAKDVAADMDTLKGEMDRVEKDRTLTAALRRFLDALSDKLTPEMRRHLDDFDGMQSNWGRTQMIEVLSHALFRSTVPDNRGDLSKLKSMQQSNQLFPMLKHHLFDSVVTQWGSEQALDNLDVFLGKDGEYKKAPEGMLGSIQSALGMHQTTVQQLRMTQGFIAGGVVEEADLFNWMLPQLIAAWQRHYQIVFTLTVSLPRIVDVVGDELAAQRGRLEHELQVLADTNEAEGAANTVATVTDHLLKYTSVSKSRLFLDSLLKLVGTLGPTWCKKDQLFANCEGVQKKLETDWNRGQLKDVNQLEDDVEAVLNGFDERRRAFLAIVSRNASFLKKVLAGMKSNTKFVYIKDRDTMAALQQRILDNELGVAAEDAAAVFGNILPYLAKVIGPHKTFQAFMDMARTIVFAEQACRNVETEAEREQIRTQHLKEFSRVKALTLQMEKVFQSLNVKEGAKDTKLLEEALELGEWEFVNPSSVSGEPEILARHTATLKVGATVLTREEAAGLRDRLYLETDENDETEAAQKLVRNIGLFHQQVVAVTAYNLILVKLYLRGHRETGNTYKVSLHRGATPEEIRASHAAHVASLAKWNDGVADLRNEHPFMNFYTVHQLMLIGDGLRQNQVDYPMLRYARPVDEGSIDKAFIKRNFTDLVGAATPTGMRSTGQLSRQFSQVSASGLRLIEAVGVFLTAVFERLSPAFRRFDAPSLPPVDVIPGEINLVVAPTPTQTLPTLLSMYARLERVPLASECLFCTESTTLEEVMLLVRRCFDDARMATGGEAQGEVQSKRRSCLVNANALSHSMQQHVVNHITDQVRSQYELEGFELVILCSESRCLFADSFRRHERIIVPLDKDTETKLVGAIFPDIWSADQANPYVKVFTADKVGVGKTFQARRSAREECPAGQGEEHVSSVPMSNQTETADALLGYLREQTYQTPHAYHINVAATCSSACDYLLFQLVVVNDLVDKSGRHYWPVSRDAFFIELPSEKNLATGGVPLTDTLQFCMSLPMREISMQTDPLDTEQAEVQLVAKYLYNLDRGSLAGEAPRDFIAGREPPLAHEHCITALSAHLPTINVEGGAEHSVLDESMILTMTFVRFLHSMLSVIDNVFMNAEWGGMLGKESLRAMGKPDFKERLVRSLIQTSKEYAGRTISPYSLLPEQAKAMGLEPVAGGKAFGLMASWLSRPMILPTPASTYELLCLDPATVPHEIKSYWGEGFTGISGFKFKDYTQITKAEAQQLLQRLTGVRAAGPLVEQKFSSFVLTIDNILKMVAVYFRVSAGISVVIMGETGCGKTFSISYLSAFLSIPFFKLDVHGGIGEPEVKEFMVEPIRLAQDGSTVWVFLDEVNTCDALGLFKEMLCDHTMDGKLLPSSLKILAACNPYRVRPPSMLRSGGLTVVKDDGDKSAMRSDLVYVVHPLPETLLDYVWDYGTLNKEEEKRYIASMLRTEFEKMKRGADDMAGAQLESFIALFAETVVNAHEFLRSYYDGEVSVVSLRDVARCIKLFAWFQDAGPRIKSIQEGTEVGTAPERALESMVLAVCHCYHFRLMEDPPLDEDGNDTKGRKEFKEEMTKVAKDHAFVRQHCDAKIRKALSKEETRSKLAGNKFGLELKEAEEAKDDHKVAKLLSKGAEKGKKEMVKGLTWYKETLTATMRIFMEGMMHEDDEGRKFLPAGIAPNEALTENIFMCVPPSCLRDPHPPPA